MLLEALVGVRGRHAARGRHRDRRRAARRDVTAEGDLDFRGTLGVDKETPVGFQRIRLNFALSTDAPEEQLASLIRLTERYCVVLQTLRRPPETSVSRAALPG